MSLVEMGGTVIGLLQAVWLKLLIDGVVQNDGRAIAFAAAAIVASVGLGFVFVLAGNHARIGLAERVGFEFDRQIADLTSGIPSLEHQERADYLDQLEIIRERRAALGWALNSVLNLARTLVFAVTTIVIAAAVEPRLLILSLAGLPALVGTRYRYRWNKNGEDTAAAPGRLTRHFSELITDQNAAMELRVFGLQREALPGFAWVRSA